MDKDDNSQESPVLSPESHASEENPLFRLRKPDFSLHKPVPHGPQQRSVELAKAHSIGVFRHHARQEFLLPDPILEEITEPVVLDPVKDFAITQSHPKESFVGFRFMQGNLRFHLNTNSHGIGKPTCDFLITQHNGVIWIDGNIDMNRRAAEYSLNVIENLLIKGRSCFEKANKTNMDLVRLRGACTRAIQLFKEKLPPTSPMKATEKRHLQSNPVDFLFLDQGEMVEKPFPDEDVKVHAFPFFASHTSRAVEGMAGAFRFQKDGLRAWTQFRNIDGSKAAEFLCIHPSIRGTSRPKYSMFREQALQSLMIIEQGLTEAKRKEFAATLFRLREEAMGLKEEKTFKRKKEKKAWPSEGDDLMLLEGHHSLGYN